jgi:hypothetical protein
MIMLLVVSAYAWDQVRRGALDALMRAGLLLNLFGVAVLWLRTDKPMEGPILLVLATRHGITLADLLIVVPLAAVVGVLRDRPAPRPRSEQV